MLEANSSIAALPRLVERPGKVSLFFDQCEPAPGLRCRNIEIGLPFRSPPRAALSDIGKLQPILGNLLGFDLELSGTACSRWLASRPCRSASGLELEIGPSAAVLWGTLRGSEPEATFSLRLLPRRSESGLTLELAEMRVYGLVPQPAGALLRTVVREVLGVLPCHFDEAGPFVHLDLLQPLLLATLASSGWKVPLRANVRVAQLQLGCANLSASFTRSTGDAPGLAPMSKMTARLVQAEQALWAGELEKAVPLWLAELREKSQVAWCTDRLAQALAVRPEMFAQPERVLDNFFRARPEFPAGLLAAATLALRREEHSAAAERFEALARQPGESIIERVLALTAAGHAIAPAEPQRAAVYFDEALRLRRDYLPALAGAAALPGTGDTAVQVQRLRRLLAHEQDAGRAAALHVAIGQMLLAEHSEPGSARRHFERALGLRPERIEAGIGIASALVAGGAGDRGLALLAYLVERQLADGMVPEAIALLLHRARLAGALPGMEDTARDSLRRVLTLEPDNGDAREALEAIEAPPIPAPPGRRDDRAGRAHKEGLVTQVVRLSLELDGSRQQGPQLRGQLESALASVDNWPDFLEDLRRRTQSVDDPELRLRILLQGGEICEYRLDDPLQAEEWFGQVLQQDPEQVAALDALIRLLGRREAWPRMVELLLKRAGRARDTDHWAELLLRCAEVLGRRMGEQPRAIAVLEAVLEALPGHTDARWLLASSLEGAGRFEESLAQLELLEDGLEGRQMLTLLERRAQLLLGPLQRPKEGIQQLVSILKFDPNHEGALASLDELYQERGNPKMELAVVERRLANLVQKGGTGDEERMLRSNLFLRRARLRRLVRGVEEAEGVRRDLEMAIKDWRGNAEAAEELVEIYRAEHNVAGLRRALPLLTDMMLAGSAREQLVAELASLGPSTDAG